MIYFLVNSLTVSGRTGRAIRRAQSQFQGQETTLRQVTDIRDYRAFFDSLREDDQVIFLGGDGTLNYFANATRGMTFRHPIYACKGGTGNDFLRDILGRDAPDGTLCRINEYLDNLPTVLIDGKEYVFLNNAAFGIDGHVCSAIDDLKAKGFKRLNYTAVAAGLLLVYKPTSVDIEIDGEKAHFDNVWLAPVMNGRCFGGGMMMAPFQDRRTDKATLAIFHCKSRLLTMLRFPSIFGGKHIKYEKNLYMKTGHEITVRFNEPRDFQMDGEVIRHVTEYRVVKGVPAGVRG